MTVSYKNGHDKYVYGLQSLFQWFPAGAIVIKKTRKNEDPVFAGHNFLLRSAFVQLASELQYCMSSQNLKNDFHQAHTLTIEAFGMSRFS